MLCSEHLMWLSSIECPTLLFFRAESLCPCNSRIWPWWNHLQPPPSPLSFCSEFWSLHQTEQVFCFHPNRHWCTLSLYLDWFGYWSSCKDVKRHWLMAITKWQTTPRHTCQLVKDNANRVFSLPILLATLPSICRALLAPMTMVCQKMSPDTLRKTV